MIAKRNQWRQAALCLFATAVAAATAFPFASAARAATQLGALPWLTVAHPTGGRPQIVDPTGRTVLLRGVNVVGVEDDFYQGASLQTTTPKWPIDPVGL